MHDLELIPRRWLEYEPPSLCHEPITTTLAMLGLGEAAAGAGSAAAASAVLGGAGETALLASAGIPVGVAAGLPAAAAPAAAGGLGLGTIGEIASVAGTGISVAAGMRDAEYKAAVARAQAEGLKQKADQDAAAGEQEAIQRQRQSDYVQSKYRAGMAASGTTPVGEDTTLSDIGAQGQYNTLASLYRGLTASAASRRQADIDLFGAQNVEGAAPVAAAGTVLAGLSSFADKRARLRYYTKVGESPAYA